MRYKAGGAAVVVCDEGYQLKQISNNKLVCREDGSWKQSSLGSDFPICAEKGCLYDDLVIVPPENGNVEVGIAPHIISYLINCLYLGDWKT